ncbi:hypothetical protein Desdi_2892 [Desulfitobacterium dichloroeliminans LMG P-21439]|uniref:Class I SAM-dependent methyltransferase n=1 Tax=Desulfitobacterium dichloroeliminans (strain LMG P-21439 / DCA1) TaxID=871963 RepID=L0F8Z8_DESDL|nr:class I SAM-dependent methyltransferase [Desulfitobacterium dichloroeliminans]AGA70304.1 hypothetical protein Desdi_2892 [Desulfitobacterium dichloroeliminans LMG P-21439]
MQATRTKQLLHKNSIKGDAKICIFGAGDYGKRLYCLLKFSSIAIAMFADNNPIKWGKPVFGDVICQGPDTLLPNKECLLMIVAIKNEPEKIAAALRDMGFPYIVLMGDIIDKLEINAMNLVEDIGAELVRYMAYSGVGTDKCLEYDCLPMQRHFYQPIPDIKDLERRNIWERKSKLSGIRWEADRYVANLKDIAKYQPAYDWALSATADPLEFHLANSSFSYICASFLYGMIRKHRPQKIIEIGSGNSTRVIRKAIMDNMSDGVPPTSYKVIDPYCAFGSLDHAEIINMPVEEVDLTIFEELEENDILFIDSSHTVRIGGDVNYEILEILPILGPGVLIHFHDIPMPYEYGKTYATDPTFRVFWTESYLLQAFFVFNDSFEVLLPAMYLLQEQLAVCNECYPSMMNTDSWHSASLWLRRMK